MSKKKSFSGAQIVGNALVAGACVYCVAGIVTNLKAKGRRMVPWLAHRVSAHPAQHNI